MQYISSTAKLSQENISKMYPTRAIEDLGEYYGNSGSNINIKETLRGNNKDSIYYICPIYDTNEYTEPVTEKYKRGPYDLCGKHFGEDDQSLKNVKKAVKRVKSIYKYSKKIINENFTLDDMEIAASNKTSPYIATNWQYDHEFGVLMNNTIHGTPTGSGKRNGGFSTESKFTKEK